MEDFEKLKQDPLTLDLIQVLKNNKNPLVELSPQAVLELFLPIIEDHSNQIEIHGRISYIQACIQEAIEQWEGQRSVRGDTNKTRFLAAMWIAMKRSEFNEIMGVELWGEEAPFDEYETYPHRPNSFEVN